MGAEQPGGPLRRDHGAVPARRKAAGPEVRLVIQRVSRAAVRVDRTAVAEIGRGLLVLVGVARGEGEAAAGKAADKTWRLRVFPSDGQAGVGDLSAADLGLPVLAVSQFTLFADTSRGRRPSYILAAPPEEAAPAFGAYCGALESLGAKVERGVFGAHMEVESVNDGPVTVILDV